MVIMPQPAAYNNIKRIRIQRKLTQTELSRRSGVSSSTIGNLEKSGSQPRRDVCDKLAEALGVTPDQIRGFDTIYNRTEFCPPKESGRYLCAFKTTPRSPYTFGIFNFNSKQGVWTTPGDTMPISAWCIKWWAEIPPVPDY